MPDGVIENARPLAIPLATQAAATALTLSNQAMSPQAHALVADLLDRITAWEEQAGRSKRRGANQLAGLRRAVEALVGGLLLARAKDGANAWSGQSMRRDSFTATRIGFRQFMAAHEAMKALRLVEHEQGRRWFYDFGSAVGRRDIAAVHRATPELVLLAAEFDMPFMDARMHWGVPDDSPKNAPLIQLKGMRVRQGAAILPGGNLPLPDTEEVETIHADTLALNAFLTGFSYQGCKRPRLRRIFTQDFRHHGRWYGGIEGMPKAERQAILIGGQPVVEVDVRASHLTILHGLAKVPLPPSDPYDLRVLTLPADARRAWERVALPRGLHAFHIPRDVVKAWVTASIGNGRPIQRWATRQKAEAPSGQRLADYPAVALGKLILARYPFLGRLPEVVGTEQRMVPHRLMALEAEALGLAMKVLGWGRQVPALPVHDALVVPRDSVQDARNALMGSYSKLFGVRPVARID